MRNLLKNPLFYTNVLLMLLLVAVVALGDVSSARAKIVDYFNKAFAANVSGGGTINQAAAFTNSSTIGDSIIYDSGTSIGISNTNPGAKLDISATSDPLLRLRQGANPATTFRVGTDGAMVVDNDGVANVLTLSGGNVGIGTANPSSKLHVYNGTSYVEVKSESGSATGYGALVVQNNVAGHNGYLLAGGSSMTGTMFGLNNADLIKFYSNNTPFAIGTSDNYDLTLGANSAAVITVKNTGNVGIGTADPQAKLHVNGVMMLTPQTTKPSAQEGMIWLCAAGSACLNP